MSKKGLPSKKIRKLIDKIAPDLEELLHLLNETDEDHSDSVVEDNIRTGAHNLLIAKRIIKERKK
ncbi:MAG: hypothetical protein C0605_03480 [Hyphomicrobiales bacterium]|nr:MAG: hypothetical protein C0605_03480 [Hyphomicrobiales bacterium]